MNRSVVRTTRRGLALLALGFCFSWPASAQQELASSINQIDETPSLFADGYAAPAAPQKGGEQSSGSAETKPVEQTLHGNFFRRLVGFYAQDWKGTAAGGAAPARRALDAPLDSPPFPSGDWGYGGSPLLGVPDTNV